jgi:hypothetical protein
MDITIDTGENKIIVHLEKYDQKKSFAVMINSATGTTIKTTIGELVKALEVIAGNKEKQEPKG